MTAPGLRYTIDVSLDTDLHRLVGWSEIHYRSGADSALPSIYLHAYPNAFSGPNTIYARDAARQAEDYTVRLWRPEDRGWMVIDSVTADGAAASIAIDETVARIDLPKPLAVEDSVSLRLHFTVQIPTQYDRFGHRGDNYSIAQWYPKVAVYDEQGWHPDPFHYAAEFYGDFGTFDVAITLPDRYWVGSTGVIRGAEGGDNEVPLAKSSMPKDSVTVSLSVIPADSLRERWPRVALRAESDLGRAAGADPLAVVVPRDGQVLVRVPRGAPIHYAYRWDDGGGSIRSEADTEGRAGPLRFLVATRDTTVRDTLRTLAPAPGPDGPATTPSRKTLRFRAEQVHDFAWVASPHYVRSDTAWSGISIRTLVYRDDEDRWRGLPRFTVDALRHHSELVGPYPWPQFTSVEAWCGGSAMEYPMLVMTEPGFQSDRSHLLDATNAHEAGHSWFYGAVASDERADPWIDEGFSQYLEIRYVDGKYPRGMYEWSTRFPWIGTSTAMDADELGYLAAAWARDEEPVGTPAERQPGYESYAVAAYSKPFCMLWTLRGVVGESLFQEFVREFYRRFRFRHPRPADVFQTAEDVTGRDLDAFFRDWIETVRRPSFSLGAIRRRETGGRHTTSVIVRREEGMVLPVTVEARFADGTRQERQVLASDRETVAAFESASRLESAVLDPRHELIEMDRLDNGSGFLPPTRFHFLAGYPSAEAIGAAYGPTVWHGEAEGMRLGAWIDGRYLPSSDFPFGIRGFEGGISYGADDGSVALRGGLWRRWGALGARSRVRALAARDAGLFRAALSAENVAMAPSRLHPYRAWSVSVEYRDRYDLEPVDPAHWSEGRTLNAGLTLGLETIGPRRLENLALAYRHGAAALRDEGDDAPDANYDWIQASARQVLEPLPGGYSLTWRVAVGSVFRRVPREQLFDIAEASRLDALNLFYANDRGPLRETDHFHVPGGGGLRGYSGRSILGRSHVGLNLEVESGRLPVFAFGGVGSVEANGWGGGSEPAGHPLVGRWLAEAGLGVRLGPAAVALPVWLGSPDPGESPWDFRWTFSVGVVNLPRL